MLAHLKRSATDQGAIVIGVDACIDVPLATCTVLVKAGPGDDEVTVSVHCDAGISLCSSGVGIDEELCSINRSTKTIEATSINPITRTV